jgi:hypothetical protein
MSGPRAFNKQMSAARITVDRYSIEYYFFFFNIFKLILQRNQSVLELC